MTFVDMLPNQRVIYVVNELLLIEDPFDTHGFLLEYEDLLRDGAESAVTYRIDEVIAQLAEIIEKDPVEGDTVPKGTWRSLMNALPPEKLESLGDLRHIGDTKEHPVDVFVEYDYWISDEAGESGKEKIRTVLRHISQRGVGERVFLSYSPKKIRTILDHYGWEESPKLIYFLKGLPAETTFDEAAELFKNA